MPWLFICHIHDTISESIKFFKFKDEIGLLHPITSFDSCPSISFHDGEITEQLSHSLIGLNVLQKTSDEFIVMRYIFLLLYPSLHCSLYPRFLSWLWIHVIATSL